MFTLLHTNDFHNCLTDIQSEKLRTLRNEVGAQGLLLDAGDAVCSGNVTFRPGGEPILARMAQIGYDAMTVGNREFHFSQRGFHCKLSLAPFPILCANVRLAKTPIPSPPAKTTRLASEMAAIIDPPVRPFIVCETGGWRVLVFGLTVPMITQRMLSRKISAYVFEDPLATAATLVPRLRADHRPDLLVALTHIGLERDRHLAHSVPGIDLIIGGHSHTVLQEGERVNATLIVQTGCYGHHLGRVHVERSEDGAGPPRLCAMLEVL